MDRVTQSLRMTRSAFALAIATASVCAPPAAAQPDSAQPDSAADPQETSEVTLRPIDRATVRIVSVRGLGIHTGRGRRTRVARAGADPVTSHGSGVAIGPQLVLTARHVVWGAEAWVAFAPGTSTPIAARPVYVDPVHDIAFLFVDRALPDSVELPPSRRLTLSERVSVSGYPLDLREPIPAAASGEVSRVTRSGELHLTMSVNPGHSGGPVIDGQGRLVGILSARGRLDAGVEGLAIAITLQNVRAAHTRLPTTRPRFDETDRDLARAITQLTNMEGGDFLDQLPAITPIVERAAAWTDADADRDVIIAALAWNALLELLEARNAHQPAQLPPADQANGQLLHRAARVLATRALEHGPHIRRRFPIVRAIALGHVDAAAERPARFD